MQSLCEEVGLKFHLSFYTPNRARDYGHLVHGVKISSYDVINKSLLEAVSRLGKPVYLSTGMASPIEISEALDILAACPLASLLHCISKYPVKSEDCNLARIESLQWAFGNSPQVGWSDHSGRPAVVQRACHMWEADCIELHVDLDDRQGVEQGQWVWPMVRAAVMCIYGPKI